MHCVLFAAVLFLFFSGLSNAQVPSYTNILTFTSPVRLVATNTNVFRLGGATAIMGSQQTYLPSIQVSSIGSARYLILALNGSTDGVDKTTNISYYRNYTNGSNYILVATSSIHTNLAIPSGGVFVFPMNPTTKTITSTTPVYKLTNSSQWYSVSGVWNVTNGFRASYFSSSLTTNTSIMTMVGPYGSYTVTNKAIYIDRSIPKSVTVYTTNIGQTWITSSIPGSGNPGYVSDNEQGNHDLTNNYYAVLSQSNTNSIVQVYRFPP
jgi:hypothetical protein